MPAPRAVVAGCVLAVAEASHNDPTLSLDQLFSLYATLTFGLYAAAVGGSMLAVLAVVWYIERLEKRVGGPLAPEYQRAWGGKGAEVGALLTP